MCKLEAKVYTKVCERHKHEDRRFTERCKDLSASFTPTAVGLPEDYSGPYPLTVEQLNKLQDVNSPLGKLYCIQEVMVCVCVLCVVCVCVIQSQVQALGLVLHAQVLSEVLQQFFNHLQEKFCLGLKSSTSLMLQHKHTKTKLQQLFCGVLCHRKLDFVISLNE